MRRSPKAPTGVHAAAERIIAPGAVRIFKTASCSKLFRSTNQIVPNKHLFRQHDRMLQRFYSSCFSAGWSSIHIAPAGTTSCAFEFNVHQLPRRRRWYHHPLQSAPLLSGVDGGCARVVKRSYTIMVARCRKLGTNHAYAVCLRRCRMSPAHSLSSCSLQFRPRLPAPAIPVSTFGFDGKSIPSSAATSEGGGRSGTPPAAVEDSAPAVAAEDGDAAGGDGGGDGECSGCRVSRCIASAVPTGSTASNNTPPAPEYRDSGLSSGP